MGRNSKADRARGERMLAQALEHVRQADIVAEAGRQALLAALRGHEWGLEHAGVVKQLRAATVVRSEARRMSARVSNQYDVEGLRAFLSETITKAEEE